MKLYPVLIIVVVTLAARPVSAQYQPPYYQARASTAGESHARGMSEVVRAAGDTNLRNSEAAINYEAARSAELDNNLKYTETHYEKKEINRAYRESRRRPPLTTEQAHRLAKARAPKRPNGSQLDQITGEIDWPFLLQTDEFSGYCKKLEGLFSSRAETEGSIGYRQYSEIKRTTDAMLALLKRNIRKYRPQDWTEANKFVKGLAYEARHPVS